MKRSKQPSSRRLDLRFRHKLALETPAEASFVEKFNALAGMSDDEKLDKEFALKALRTIRDLIHERVRSESKGGISVTIPPNIRYISIPGIPDDELELEAFEAWTAGLIREAINAYAARLEITPSK